MTIQDWGALGEIVSGLAIFISFIYVSTQIRQQTKATKSATANATVAVTAAWYSAIGNNERASAMFFNFLADPDSVTAEEKFQAVMNLHGLFLSFQNSYYLAKEGTLERQIHESLNEALHGVKDRPGFRLFWKVRKSIFFKEFRDYIDSLFLVDRQVSEGLYKRPLSE